MKITLWGTRGSLPSSGPEMTKHGGNTSCVEVRENDTLLILDAGTGIRRLGDAIEKKIKKVHILLTHLHLDHIQGLGFFNPLYEDDMEVHIYGPANSNRHLHNLLTKYLSPPLFPVLLNELPCRLYLHSIPDGEFRIGEFSVLGELVCHPGLTFGYRISSKDGVMAYLPDHEPALGTRIFPLEQEWTSGFNLAANVDILIHDAQYTNEEYLERVGWGHSSIEQALAFGSLAKVKKFITFHHDPSHDDNKIEKLLSETTELIRPAFAVKTGREDDVFTIP